MSDRGYSYWEPAFDLDAQYLNGRTLANKQMPMGIGHSGRPIAVPMFDGTDAVFNVFRGTKATDGYDKKVMSLSIRANDQEDYWAFKQAHMSGGAVWYAPGYRVNDVFTATSGNTYTLSRRMANGVVPGVSEVTHPTVVLLDGVETPSAITIGGDMQTITANNTGEIVVRYMPVLWVIVVEVPDEIEMHNSLMLSVVIEEIRIGDQG